jgi:hypothetical protein
MPASPLQADRRIADWLFLLTAVAYAWFFAGGGWNQNAQFDLTRAMVERHTFAIDNYAGNSGDVSRWKGHLYANKSPGVSFLAALPYAALHALEKGRFDESSPQVVTVNAYVCTVFAVGLLGAAIPALLYGHARRRGWSARWSAIVALVVALATQLFPYSTLLMAQVPSAALLFASYTLAVREERPRNGPRLAAAGFLAGLAALTNYLCVPCVGIVALLAGAVDRGRWKVHVAAFTAGALPPLAFLALYQKLTTGGFLRTPMSTMDARFVTPHALLGILKSPSWEAFVGITVSPYRGLFFFAPVLVMALGGLILWWRSRAYCAELLAITAIAFVFFAFNVTFNGWEGGFGIGARYLVPLIPFLGLALLHLRGALRPAMLALAALSFVFNFAATAVDPQPSATIPSPMTGYILPLLVTGRFPASTPITPPWSAATFTGHTSVNRMTMSEPVPFLLAPPFTPLPEWASFNLGETIFGPGNAWSLLPILLVLVVSAWGIVWKAAKVDQAELRTISSAVAYAEGVARR